MSTWLPDPGREASVAPLPSDPASEPHSPERVVASIGSCPVPDGGDNAKSSKYTLQAVIMHVGGPSVGHYYAYVRRRSVKPTALSDVGSAEGSARRGAGEDSAKGGVETTTRKREPARWVRLDDDRVQQVSEEEVLRDAFGGGGDSMGLGLSGVLGQVRRRSK